MDHEQSRSDRNQFVTVFTDRIEEGKSLDNDLVDKYLIILCHVDKLLVPFQVATGRSRDAAHAARSLQ